MARLRSVPRKGRDEAAKKQPAGMKKQPAGKPAAMKKQPAAMKKQPAATKKQTAAMKKRAAEPERAVAGAMKRAGKSGEATSDGCLPPTLVGEDDTILLRPARKVYVGSFTGIPALATSTKGSGSSRDAFLSGRWLMARTEKKLRQAFIR